MRRVIAPLAVLIASLTGGHLSTEPTAVAVTGKTSEHRRIVQLWSVARQARAIDRDLVVSSADHAQPHQAPGATATTSAAWTAGGPVTLTTGRVFFTEGHATYSCSGSAVHTDVGNVVLTAGHCVHGGGRRGAFVTDWIFFPGWSEPATTFPLGAWTATDLFTTTAWSSDRSFDDDAGFAVVTGDPGRATLEEELTDTFGATAPTIDFASRPVAGDMVSALGYPVEKRGSGNVLTFCGGPVETGLDAHETIAVRCDMVGGSSGGPWFGAFANVPGNTGVIRSLVSYVYTNLKGYLFGPILGAAEHTAFQAASTTGRCASDQPAGFACVHRAA